MGDRRARPRSERIERERGSNGKETGTRDSREREREERAREREKGQRERRERERERERGRKKEREKYASPSKLNQDTELRTLSRTEINQNQKTFRDAFRIPLGLLPVTFRDAVFLTRSKS